MWLTGKCWQCVMLFSVYACQQTSPVIGCSSPHQHDGFLPDFLRLDGLLVFTTRGADAHERERGREKDRLC